MRKGFPVRGYQVRPLVVTKRADKVERAALPEAIAALLPTDADQTFLAHDDALVFVAPLRKGKLDATAVRLMP